MVYCNVVRLPRMLSRLESSYEFHVESRLGLVQETEKKSYYRNEKNNSSTIFLPNDAYVYKI